MVPSPPQVSFSAATMAGYSDLPGAMEGDEEEEDEGGMLAVDVSDADGRSLESGLPSSQSCMFYVDPDEPWADDVPASSPRGFARSPPPMMETRRKSNQKISFLDPELGGSRSRVRSVPRP
jgi:hypothetical protein